MSRWSARVIEGRSTGTAIPLGEAPFVIGRGQTEHGRLGDDPELSRLHARIVERSGGLEIEDLGSSNGTFVNGDRITGPTALRAGDVVQVGDTRLEIAEEAPEPLTPGGPGPGDETRIRPAPRRDEPAPGAASPPAPSPVSVAPRAILRVVTGRAAGTRIPLTDEPFDIGRAGSEAGRLGDDPELSREHARVVLVDDRLAIEDTASSNGTFVNGRRIVYPTVIEPGDSIYVGDTTIEVLEGPASSPSRIGRAATGAIRSVRSAETGLLDRLARLVATKPKQVMAATGVFFVLMVLFGAPTVGILVSHPGPDQNAESTLAKEKLETATGTQLGVGMIALVRTGNDVDTAAARTKVERVVKEIESDDDVASTLHYYRNQNPALVSKDRQSTYVAVIFKKIGDAEAGDAAIRIAEEVEKQPGVLAGGEGMTGPTLGEQIGEDIGKAERLAFPILFLFSLFIFRGFVAALLPLFVGIITIFTTLVGLRLINAAITDISVFAVNMVIGLGLGLAIDYSLFIVSRYREEIARTGVGPEAIQKTLATAGRTIIFSALTVAAALAALLVFPQGFLRSMGIGGTVCSLVALGVALISLPALLALLGERVNAGVPKRFRWNPEVAAAQETQGFWYRLSRGVMKRPAPIAAAAAAFLILVGLPFLNINFNGFDASVLPETSNVRKVDTALKTEFPANRSRQINLAVEAPRSAGAEVQQYATILRTLPNVVDVGRPRPLKGGIWQVDVIPRYGDPDERTHALVESIRDQRPGFPVSAAGGAATFVDQEDSLAAHLPLALTLLVLWTVFILFALTGSVILPIKSIIMNLLTVSAAFGLLVLIFQDGRFEGLLDFQSNGGIEMTQPLLLFAMAFGLSTDYAVFLLTRIKEARDAGNSETEAVAIGLERTGRIVTSAALLFCIAIGAFATSEIIFIKEVGIGTALAVIIDATIVRALLVPSLMALLGRRNWWAPAPLRRLHKRFGISEG